jgi:uncharacterized phage-associated protein
MSRVLNVAEYILRRLGAMDTMKLQKLVYYSQAWSLAWTGLPLFLNRIEAWRDGPVCPDLFHVHKKRYTIATVGGDADALSPKERDTIDSVLAFYGERSADWLSEVTHQEDPWREARRGLLPFQSSQREITHDAMKLYYRSRAQQK